MCECGQVIVTGAGVSGSGGRSILEMMLPQLGISRQTAQQHLCVSRCTHVYREVAFHACKQAFSLQVNS